MISDESLATNDYDDDDDDDDDDGDGDGDDDDDDEDENDNGSFPGGSHITGFLLPGVKGGRQVLTV